MSIHTNIKNFEKLYHQHIVKKKKELKHLEKLEKVVKELMKISSSFGLQQIENGLQITNHDDSIVFDHVEVILSDNTNIPSFLLSPYFDILGEKIRDYSQYISLAGAADRSTIAMSKNYQDIQTNPNFANVLHSIDEQMIQCFKKLEHNAHVAFVSSFPCNPILQTYLDQREQTRIFV